MKFQISNVSFFWIFDFDIDAMDFMKAYRLLFPEFQNVLVSRKLMSSSVFIDMNNWSRLSVTKFTFCPTIPSKKP